MSLVHFKEIDGDSLKIKKGEKNPYAGMMILEASLEDKRTRRLIPKFEIEKARTYYREMIDTHFKDMELTLLEEVKK